MVEAKQNNEVRLKCIYGNKVKLQSQRTMETFQFELVTFTEEKLADHKISNYTKVGKAIWAKETGAIVSIDMFGKGLESYKIVEIDHA